MSATDPNPVAELLARVRHLVEPEPPPTASEDPTWKELAAAVDELVEVVLVQQDLIENLLVRTSRLEGRAVSPRKTRRGA